MGGFSKAQRIADQLVNKDNWEAVDEIDNFVYIFDGLPDRMRLCVDLRMTGTSVKDIAKALKVSEKEVYRQLQEAKKRFLRGENII